MVSYDRLARCAANYDIIITRGDKQPITPDQVDSKLSTTAFLKAKFRFHPEFRLYVPFIHPHTLMDQLSYARDPSIESIPPNAPGLCQCINSALSFAFFWGENSAHFHDAPSFNAFRSMLLSSIPADCHMHIQTYDDFSRAFNHQPVPSLALPRSARPDAKHGYIVPQMEAYDEADYETVDLTELIFGPQLTPHVSTVRPSGTELDYLSVGAHNPLSIVFAACDHQLLEALWFLLAYHRDEFAHVLIHASDHLDPELFPHLRQVKPPPRLTFNDEVMRGFLGFSFHKKLMYKHSQPLFMVLYPADTARIQVAKYQGVLSKNDTLKAQFATDHSTPQGLPMQIMKATREISISNYNLTASLLKKVQPQAVALAQSKVVRFLVSPWRVKNPFWKQPEPRTQVPALDSP
jgi:hypothetical protein